MAFSDYLNEQRERIAKNDKEVKATIPVILTSSGVYVTPIKGN